MAMVAWQFRWREPDETGGVPVSQYRLQISPAPQDAEQPLDAEVQAQTQTLDMLR